MTTEAKRETDRQDAEGRERCGTTMAEHLRDDKDSPELAEMIKANWPGWRCGLPEGHAGVHQFSDPRKDGGDDDG